MGRIKVFAYSSFGESKFMFDRVAYVLVKVASYSCALSDL